MPRTGVKCTPYVTPIFQKYGTTMKITIIGTGYVGLVTGACLAELNAMFASLDAQKKFDLLNNGGIPHP